jgi:hypothetical protein
LQDGIASENEEECCNLEGGGNGEAEVNSDREGFVN